MITSPNAVCWHKNVKPIFQEVKIEKAGPD
jgi:hypothetical protein